MSRMQQNKQIRQKRRMDRRIRRIRKKLAQMPQQEASTRQSGVNSSTKCKDSSPILLPPPPPMQALRTSEGLSAKQRRVYAVRQADMRRAMTNTRAILRVTELFKNKLMYFVGKDEKEINMFSKLDIVGEENRDYIVTAKDFVVLPQNNTMGSTDAVPPGFWKWMDETFGPKWETDMTHRPNILWMHKHPGTGKDAVWWSSTDRDCIKGLTQMGGMVFSLVTCISGDYKARFDFNLPLSNVPMEMTGALQITPDERNLCKECGQHQSPFTDELKKQLDEVFEARATGQHATTVINTGRILAAKPEYGRRSGPAASWPHHDYDGPIGVGGKQDIVHWEDQGLICPKCKYTLTKAELIAGECRTSSCDFTFTHDMFCEECELAWLDHVRKGICWKCYPFGDKHAEERSQRLRRSFWGTHCQRCLSEKLGSTDDLNTGLCDKCRRKAAEGYYLIHGPKSVA